MSDPDRPDTEALAAETAGGRSAAGEESGQDARAPGSLAAGRTDTGGGPNAAVQEAKWWIDTGAKQLPEARERVHQGVVERWAFELLKDYRQEQALHNIVDINGQVLRELGAREEKWVDISLGVGRFPLKRLNYIKDSLRIPRYARALAIDAGYSVRVLVTGNPPGQKVLDLNFTEAPSLDYWVEGELVEEQLFRSVEDALKRLRHSVHRYLRRNPVEETPNSYPRSS